MLNVFISVSASSLFVLLSIIGICFFLSHCQLLIFKFVVIFICFFSILITAYMFVLLFLFGSLKLKFKDDELNNFNLSIFFFIILLVLFSCSFSRQIQTSFEFNSLLFSIISFFTKNLANSSLGRCATGTSTSGVL